MTAGGRSGPSISRPSPIILAAVYFFYLTVILRTLAEAEALSSWLPFYLVVEILFGGLFTTTLWRPLKSGLWKHLYFGFQALMDVILVLLHPDLDFTNVLLVMLSFQAAMAFSGRNRWTWGTTLILLIVLPLSISLHIYGLALSLLPAAVAIVFQAYILITQEIEAGQRKLQDLLTELQSANHQLIEYSGQVDELSAIQERNRLARELHDSVSQILFSISLHSRSTRILLERDPDRLRPQLEELQSLTHRALEEMRSLIAELRPQETGSAHRPTSPVPPSPA